MKAIKRIAYLIASTRQSSAVLEEANRLALECSAELYSVNVTEPLISDAIIGKENFKLYVKRVIWSSRKMLKGIIAAHTPKGTKAHCIVRNGDPAYEITKSADRNHTDLIVVGTHGRSGLPHLMFDSINDRVIRHTLVPVVATCDRQERNMDKGMTLLY